MTKLSEKEIRFIELKAQGYSHPKISKLLYISLRYVHQLANSLYHKTGTRNGASLVSWGYENGILKINAPNLPTKPDEAA